MSGKTDTMKAYMQEIGQIPLVSREEEVDLAAQIAAGNAEARQKLIQSNLRLVVKIAHDFKGLGLPLVDLISEGNIGLMKAVEKFNPLKGAKFSSYAAWWIKQSMRRALSNQSRTIRIPVQSAGKINKIKATRIKLTEDLGREPTDTEIANHLDFSERTVTALRLAELRTFSLQDPIQQGEDSVFQDIIPDAGASTPDEMLCDLEMLRRLKGLIDKLDDREKLILILRFGLDGARPKTLEEVSRIIGRTRERVRQIQNQALKKLRKLIDEEFMKDPDYYFTDAIGKEAIAFLEATPEDKPFFLYLPFTAAHWPLHAPAHEIEKYKGKFSAGWDELRRERLKRMKELGVIGSKVKLSTRHANVPSWEDEKHKAWQERRMEVYAAQVTIMDRVIGEVIDHLRTTGQLNDTLTFFTIDNGGCTSSTEPTARGTTCPKRPGTANP